MRRLELRVVGAWSLRVALLGVLAITACQEPPKIDVQRVVKFDELSPGITRVENGYITFDNEPTTGRFSSGLAISKLDLEAEADKLVCVQMTPREQAFWGRTLEGVSEVRGLYFLGPVDVKPDRPTTTRLCKAARNQNAGLLLLYASNRYGENAAQKLGILYDTYTAAPVAVLHAERRFVDQEGLEVAPEGVTGDQRELDAQYQAMRAFEQELIDCLSELIELDRPTPATQPHRWQTPPGQRWWLPHGG